MLTLFLSLFGMLLVGIFLVNWGVNAFDEHETNVLMRGWNDGYDEGYERGFQHGMEKAKLYHECFPELLETEEEA